MVHDAAAVGVCQQLAGRAQVLGQLGNGQARRRRV